MIRLRVLVVSCIRADKRESLRFSVNKAQNGFCVCVLQRGQHAQEADGEERAVERESEVHAGEEERVLRAEAAVGGVRDFCV